MKITSIELENCFRFILLSRSRNAEENLFAVKSQVPDY